MSGSSANPRPRRERGSPSASDVTGGVDEAAWHRADDCVSAVAPARRSTWKRDREFKCDGVEAGTIPSERRTARRAAPADEKVNPPHNFGLVRRACDA